MTKYDYYVDITYSTYQKMQDLIDKKYSKYLAGGGCSLWNNRYDAHFVCTAKQWKPIVAALRRRGKIKVTRYSMEDLEF